MTRTRRTVQFAMLALVLTGTFALGANCERWCPFGAVEALYAYAVEGNMICSLGTSNFFIFGGVLLMTFLLRRAFCGYICPIGTISELLGALGRRLKIPTVEITRAPDHILAGLKYVVLAIILWFTYQAGELVFRGFCPGYALISRNGTDITVWAYVVSGTIAGASLLIAVPFCRWLCPLAAVLNPISRFGLTRVERDLSVCRDCGLCAKSCPVAVPVDRLEEVTAARCTSCMNCIDACPQAQDDLPAISLRLARPLSQRWSQAALIAVLLACTGGAVAASYALPIPSYVKSRGTRPQRVAETRLEIHDLGCRGRANLLFYFIERDDFYEIPGYIQLKAWPGPGVADVHVSYDPALAGEDGIRQAITEPYYDVLADFWRMPPFRIEGYDPLAPR